jgi:hypothetical protein
MSRKHLARVGVARAILEVTLGPTGIFSNVTASLGGVRGA